MTRKSILLLAALVVSACGGNQVADTTAATTTAAPTTAAPTTAAPTTAAPTTAAPAGLADVCPARIVLQTNWFPESEHGGTYQVIGTEGTLDAERGAYSGEIGDTGVELEIRAGGPFIGFQGVTSLMYQDPDIFIGYVDSGEAIEFSGEFPTVGVMVNLEVSPLIYQFDPATYSFETVADIGESGVTVLHFEGSTDTDYFVGQGLLTEDQLDGSYDASPARWVAEGGAIVQQGFVTNAIYLYENVIEGWQKPVDYVLLHDNGWVQYQSPLGVRAEALAESSPCLEQLIPIMQQGWVDYMQNPEPINLKLVEIVEGLQSFWVLTPEGNAEATAQMAALGIVSNGDDNVVGNFDFVRLQDFIEKIGPVLGTRGAPVKEGLVADDIATNQFIDETIGL